MVSRNTGRIRDISWQGWWRIALRVMRSFSRHKMSMTAAGVSFFGLFGIFSAISAFVAFYGLFLDPQKLVSDMHTLHGFVPADVVISMISQMHSVSTRSNTTLISAGTFSLIVALWSAQQGTAELMIALNTAYREKMTDSPMRHLLKSLFISIEVIAGLLLATALAIGLPLLAEIMGGSVWVTQCVRAAGMVLAGILLFFGLGALYHWVPDRKPRRWRWSAAGASLVVGFWTVASVLFSIFLSYSDSYTTMYGSLSGVVLLLTLIYVTVATILIGAELNVQLEYHVAPDLGRDPDRAISPNAGSRDVANDRHDGAADAGGHDSGGQDIP